jgi:hypothetical protein
MHHTGDCLRYSSAHLDVAAAPLLARATERAEQEVKCQRRPWAANLSQQQQQQQQQQRPRRQQ